MNKAFKIIIIFALVVFVLIAGVGIYYKVCMRKITFYNESKGIIESSYVKKGSKIKLIEEPKIKNCEFVGWAIDDNKDNIIDKETKVKDNYNLYATYIHYYEVSFLDEDKNKLYDTELIREQSTVNKPKDPIKKRADFKGWLSNDSEFDFKKPILKDTTLIADFIKYEKYPDESKDLPIFAFNCYKENGNTAKNLEEGEKIYCEIGMEVFNGMCIKEYSFKFKLGDGFKLSEKSSNAKEEDDRYVYSLTSNNCGVIDEDDYFYFEVESTEKDSELYIILEDPRYTANNGKKYYALERKITMNSDYKKETLE